ncbi:MAG: 2-amino-4-hydroxy-6-hydroxymethyldihydropteridine diphosphokinase [Eubacteriales bacterium]
MKHEMVYIGLGSNLGDRQKHITKAIEMLKNTQGITVKTVSPIYETTPVGYSEQPDFLNCVVEIITSLSPYELLDACIFIENELGRKRTMKWGPRTIDLDILFYGELLVASDRLTIPHPLLHERGFVLLPLSDIAPDMLHPKLNVSIKALCEKLNYDTEKIKRFGDVA